jgi:ketosteroid isomerase-like protein
MSQGDVELVRAAWQAWEQGDMESIFAFSDPEIVGDQTHADAGELSAVNHRHDGVRQFLREWLVPFEKVYRLRAGRAVQIEVYTSQSEALKAAGLME